jgi:hypothetical protein
VIICRGCKANMQLDDSMNTVRKGVRSVHRGLDQLHESIDRLFRGEPCRMPLSKPYATNSRSESGG